MEVIAKGEQIIHLDRTRDNPEMEKPRVTVVEEVAPGLHLATVAEQHEVYTWDNGRGMTLHFNVTLIKRAILDGSKPAEIIENPIDATIVEHLTKHAGIEMWRVEQLKPDDLAMPAIGFAAQNPDTREWGLVSIDGNHRIARRALDGCPYAQIYLIEPGDFKDFICLPGEEAKFFKP